MAEPLPDTVVAAQQAEAMRMAAKESAATVIEENKKSAQAALLCTSCGEFGHRSHRFSDCKNWVALRPPTCAHCCEITGHQIRYCRSK